MCRINLFFKEKKKGNHFWAFEGCSDGKNISQHMSIMQCHRFLFAGLIKKLPKQASCKQKQCTQLLDKAQRVGQAGRSMKCSYKKPPEVQHLIWHTVIFPLVSQWLQKRHLGTSLNPSEGGNLLYSRLQGIWRAIKQPDIFLVNHKLRGNFFFFRAQLTTSRSDFSGEFSLTKILRHFLPFLSLLLLT